jgi:hypothetical protein
MKPFSLVLSRLFAGVLVLTAYGCAGGGTSTGSSASTSTTSALPDDGAGRTASGAGVQMNVEHPQADNAANWGADKGAAARGATFERGRLLKHGGGGSAGGGNSGASATVSDAQQYPKWRIDKAAVIRSWASVSIQPVGIDAFLKTAWTAGQIHIRLALLGPIGNLREFSRTQNSVKITFQDRAGNALKQIIVPMSELKEAPQGTNFGTPTYVVEGTMDCPLELYEEVYQWMFEWD